MIMETKIGLNLILNKKIYFFKKILILSPKMNKFHNQTNLIDLYFVESKGYNYS